MSRDMSIHSRFILQNERGQEETPLTTEHGSCLQQQDNLMDHSRVAQWEVEKCATMACSSN